ncbi:MAG: hypothetical protein ATN32_06390 [Candidatus Epulonipiscium fishelsonii]|nr:MAG: hypothetical protein ATN32_06390 [Epulopiscium sp. AS2M-Bin002]
MAKMIGMSRNINIQWLNKTVELINEGYSASDIKELLNEYLSFEIKSPTNLRKTREILLKIWVYEDEINLMIREEAIKLFNQYPEYRVCIHCSMISVAYPVFGDMCKLIGKMSEFQDEITLAQIKQKLFDEWGERTTLYHSIDKLVATLKSFNVLTCDKPGKYRINKTTIANDQINLLLVYTAILLDESSYYSFTELNNLMYLFPFDYRLKKELFVMDNRFVINNFGGELTVALS